MSSKNIYFYPSFQTYAPIESMSNIKPAPLAKYFKRIGSEASRAFETFKKEHTINSKTLEFNNLELEDQLNLYISNVIVKANDNLYTVDLDDKYQITFDYVNTVNITQLLEEQNCIDMEYDMDYIKSEYKRNCSTGNYPDDLFDWSDDILNLYHKHINRMSLDDDFFERYYLYSFLDIVNAIDNRLEFIVDESGYTVFLCAISVLITEKNKPLPIGIYYDLK